MNILCTGDIPKRSVITLPVLNNEICTSMCTRVSVVGKDQVTLAM